MLQKALLLMDVVILVFYLNSFLFPHFLYQFPVRYSGRGIVYCIVRSHSQAQRHFSADEYWPTPQY